MRRVGAFVALSLCVALARAEAPPREAVAIVGARIVDVARGRVSSPRTIAIADGRIVSIGADAPRGARTVDARGRFVVPGLVDLHVHLFNNASGRAPNEWAFAAFVANGVTAVREMAARPEQVAQVRAWRAALDDGSRVLPRIAAVGVTVRGDSPEDARAQVDRAVDAGADFIKVFSDVPAANWRAIVERARERGVSVAGHVPDAVALGDAAAAGQRSAEHLTGAYEACLVDGALDARRCRAAARTVARRGMLIVPTLVLSVAETKDAPLEADPRWPLLREDESARWQRIVASFDAGTRAEAARRAADSAAILRIFHDAGAPIAAGTDTPMPRVYPGSSLHEELAQLVAAGLSPGDALAAATIVPARFLSVADDYGTVEPGRRADLVLLEADPTRDIANTRRIAAVVLDGRLFTRAMLDALTPN